LIACLEKRFG
jgi:hypothetical protein